ncbi:Protein of unknown function DUF3103 [Actinobacteria bacterium OV450]|nr:Protein of unknown function DUF3103 [Actinobacteria bacterium OV450]
MSSGRIRFGALGLTVLSLIAVPAGQAAAENATPSTSASASSPASPSAGATVDKAKREVARALARSLSDKRWSAQVAARTRGNKAVTLQGLTPRTSTSATRSLARVISEQERSVARAKGLSAETGPLLRLRAAGAPDAAAPSACDVLVAAASTDDHASKITAYDAKGRAHTLDAHSAPRQAVYVVDLDTARSRVAGMEILQDELAKNGLAASKSDRSKVTDSPGRSKARDSAASGDKGFWATKIKEIQVSDVQEPWYKGEADVFALVAGYGMDGKARVDAVDMPYLDWANTVYKPGQILVNWSNYKFNTADVILWEDDGDINYKALAQSLSAILLTVTDQAAFVPLAAAVINAMPDSWWTDDPDYVESWYSLTKDSTGSLRGVSDRGSMTVEPYFVNQF